MQQKQCPLAKCQLYIHSSGKVAPCGFLQGRHWLGDLKENSIEEIWQSEKAKEFYDSHQKGENSHCEKMQEKYHCHLLHPNLTKETARKITKLDIMVDSHCNLKCIMCTNRTEENYPLKEFAWNHIASILPQIEEIELVGGEPLIIRESYELMDLVLKINPKIRWVITTNGHYELSTKMLSYLKQLNIYSLSVSIDAFESELFKKIRVNGDLEKTLNTLTQFQNELETPYLNINFLIQKNNYHHLSEALEFSKKNKITLYPILLREPEDFSILSFNEEKRKEIIKDYLFLVEKHQCLRSLNITLKLIKSLSSQDKILYMDQLHSINHAITK